MWKQGISFRTWCISKQTAPLSFSQIIGGLWSISKSGRSQSWGSHGDIGHDNDMSKSFGRMAGEVYRLTRWGRMRGWQRRTSLGFACVQRGEVGLGRECGLSLGKLAVQCWEDCEESCFDFQLFRGEQCRQDLASIGTKRIEKNSHGFRG